MVQSMLKYVAVIVISLFTAAVGGGNALADDPGRKGVATFDRTTLMVDDMQKNWDFWRNVMGYAITKEPFVLPKAENKYLGWSEDATVLFAQLKSPDGAGIGLLEVTQDGFPELAVQEHPTGIGGAILVHTVVDIEGVYERAKAAGAVLKPLGLSPTGLSKQMYVRAPSGHILEMYELLPTAAE